MKTAPWRRVLWILLAVGLVVVLVRAFQPAPTSVDSAVVERGPMQVTADDDGYTRVRERYTVTAPIQGLLLRTELRAGDPVHARQTVVAEFAPIEPQLLDARSRAEAQARIAQAQAAVLEMEARRAQAEADLELAQAELKRIEPLAAKRIVPAGDLDTAKRNARSASEGLRAAELAVQVARFEEEVARASLRDPDAAEIEEHDTDPTHVDAASPGDDSNHLRLRSPIDGRVLRVYEQSSRSLAAGSPLLEIGNTGQLEIVADYLTQDAVKVRPGMTVLLRGWGGEQGDGSEQILRGRVRVVEPAGFTKISALGVEEQRVNIVVDPVGDEAAWSALGDGYHMELQIVLWEDSDVVQVPTGALFRDGDAWQVFVVEDGIARIRSVHIGRSSQLAAQVIDGLAAGEHVVLYPGELLADGVGVVER